MLEVATTKKQRDLMAHSLGLNYGDKPYRNYFATEPGCDDYENIERLVELGLMKRGRQMPDGLIYFYVTEVGAQELGATLGKLSDKE